MRQLWTLVLNDVRMRIRDRSVLVFGLVVPVALMVVFDLVFGASEDVTLEPVTVAVALPAEDALAATVPAALRQVDLGDARVTVVAGSADQVREQVEQQTADLAVIVPEGFGAAVRAGRPVTVDAVQGEGREVEAQVVLSVVDGLLEQLSAGSVAAAAAARAGVPHAELAEVARAAVEERPAATLVPGAASDEQLDDAGALVAGQAGLFLLFTVGFAVLGLVMERDTGTLARLWSMPMRRELVVVAKALVGFLLGVVATSVLLAVGGLLFGVGFGALSAVAPLIACVVAAATSVSLVIVRLARTGEQAMIAQSITALVLGIAGGAFFPVAGGGALGALLDLNPVAAFTRGLGITTGGGGPGDIGQPVVVMLGFAAVMVVLARLLPDRGAAA